MVGRVGKPCGSRITPLPASDVCATELAVVELGTRTAAGHRERGRAPDTRFAAQSALASSAQRWS
jgi:hypothetical protein